MKKQNTKLHRSLLKEWRKEYNEYNFNNIFSDTYCNDGYILIYDIINLILIDKKCKGHIL